MNKPVTAERLYDNDGRPYSTLYEAHIDIGDICMVWAPPGNVEQERYAALIAEAFNVAHETGLTPGQLAGQRERLLACLRAEVTDLKSRMFGSTHWQGCEEAHPKCAALKRMQDAIADAEGATP